LIYMRGHPPNSVGTGAERMIRIKTNTKLTPEEALKTAVNYFGPGGVGLSIKEQGPTYAYLEGGGGYVELTTAAEAKSTGVEIISTEWESEVKRFASSLKH
jgi:hypothetical protein